MFTLKEIGELIGVKADVMRDRKRRDPARLYFGQQDGTYNKTDLIGLAIAEAFLGEGHSVFESRRMAYWIWHEVALYIEADFIQHNFAGARFGLNSSPYLSGESQNLGIPKRFAAFAKSQNPVIGDDLSLNELAQIFDVSEFLIVDLKALGEKLPEAVVAKLREAAT